ncbi:hypothetical protein [Aminivibrio sp.]|uniref:hypothetical protein n=1 Tax=Aminivibrio sp. TaxID=1872489 RepID=UPI00345E8FDF
MKTMRIRGKWLKKSVLAALCVLLGLGTGNRTVSAETATPINVLVEMKVQWDITKKDMRYEGLLNVSAFGTMERTYGKGKQREGPAADAVAMFLPQSMAMRYSYVEKETYVGPLHPGRCTARLRKSVVGRFSSEETEGGSLAIHRMSSATEAIVKNISPKGKEFASQLLQFYQREPDSLSLSVKGPAKLRISNKLTGIRIRAGKTCEVERYEKAVPLFAVGLRLTLPESGSVLGSHEWSTEGKGVPSYFDVSLSDTGGQMQEKPAAGGTGKVTFGQSPRSEEGAATATYTVSWNIGENVKGPVDDDCEKLRDKIRWIEKVIETYEDEALREWFRLNFGDGLKGMEEYQKQVEREVSEAFPDTKGNPAAIHSEFQTAPNCTTNECGAGENAPVIGGIIDGESFNIMAFDSEGNLVSQDEALMNYFRGKTDGFDGIMDHEKQHVADLTSMGYPKSIDEWAEFELRGFRKELAERKSKFERDCR